MLWLLWTMVACDWANGITDDTPVDDSLRPETSVLLTLHNQSTAPVVSFQYTQCGVEAWSEALTAPIAAGAKGTSPYLPEACYDMYAESSDGCFLEFSTYEILEPGYEHIWVVFDEDFGCF